MVESQPSKLLVAGSIPVSRSKIGQVRRVRLVGPEANRPMIPTRPTTPTRLNWADVAQLAERVLGKDEVTSSILVIGSI